MRDFFLIIGIWLTLLGAALPAAGQRFVWPYTQYTTRDGLSQQQVRAFWEDSRGYIWIGTNGGITRFDGRSLAKPLPPEHYSGRPIAGIREAPDGAIWYSSANAVYRFDGRTDTPLPMTPDFWKTVPPHLWVLISRQRTELLRGLAPELHDLSDQYRIFSDTAGAALILDMAHRRCHRILQRCETTPFPADFPAAAEVEHSMRYVSNQNTYYTWAESNLVRVAGPVAGTDSVAVYHPLAPEVFHFNAADRAVYWYREGMRYRRLEPGAFNRIDKIVADSSSRIFIATDEGFAVLHTNGPEHVEVPQARYPWSVLPDHDGGVWIGSYLDGLLRLAPGRSAAALFPLPEKNNGLHQIFPGKLRGPDGVLLFGGYRGFYYFQKNKTVLFPLGESIEALAWDARRGQYLAAGNRIYMVDSALQSVRDTVALPDGFTRGDGISALDVAPDGSIWAGARGGIAHLRPDGSVRKVFASVAPCIGLLTDNEGVRWAGCGAGLFRYDAGRDTFVRVLPEVVGTAVNSLVPLPDNILAVVTDMELLLLNIRVPNSVRLAGYWTHNNGYQLLESSENGSSFDGKHLWIPSGTGIQRLRIPAADTLAGNLFRLRIDRIEKTNCFLLQDSFPTGNVRGNTVEIALSVIHLDAGKYGVEYRVGGGDWKSAGGGLVVRVAGLEHGRNTVHFRVKIYGLEERYWPTAGCVVVADLPVWDIPAFRYVVGIAFLGVIAFMIRQYLKRKKQENLLLQANLSTTLAQLNPHILFNLLASLQNSILNRSKEEASAHLVQVSSLMREVLELSMRAEARGTYPFPTITVVREMDFLQNYLSLEAMQFQPPFRYAVENALQTPAEALVVPPLLVQPLVENAILHGIRPLAGRVGEIQIRFVEEADNLVITVADNGVGTDAGTSPPRRYRSRGGQLLRERLSYLKGLGFRAESNIRPRTQHGTIAEIRIKKMYAHHSG